MNLIALSLLLLAVGFIVILIGFALEIVRQARAPVDRYFDREDDEAA